MKAISGKDFRKGDPVTLINSFKGFIKGVDSNTGEINFTSAKNRPGEELYHGHNVSFSVHGEEVPKRTVTRFVNLYWNSESRTIYSIGLYPSEQDAKLRASHDCLVPAYPIEIPEGE